MYEGQTMKTPPPYHTCRVERCGARLDIHHEGRGWFCAQHRERKNRRGLRVMTLIEMCDDYRADPDYEATMESMGLGGRIPTL